MGFAAAAITLAFAAAGPPKLPPVRGEEPEEPAAAPAEEDPPAATPDDAAEAAPQWSVPEADEPPQPAVEGPPPEPPSTDKDRDRDRAPEPTAPSIPGEDELAPTLRLPPPERPPFRGNGLFIGAGVTFGIALAEQVVGFVLVKRNCIDPIASGDLEDTDNVGDIFTGCAPGVLPALALRLHSDLGLLATIGLAAGGASLRGQQDAWDDVFTSPKPRKIAGLRAGGISLIGAGIVTWFVTGAAAWGILGKCKTGRCANGSRAMAFSTRSASAAMVASGAGMLAYAEAHRRHRGRYERDKAMSVAPAISRTSLGLTLRGVF